MDNTFATIISLLPFEIVETKPGLNPNEFTIKKADGDKFGLTIIPNDVYYLVNPDLLADAKDVRNIKVPVIAVEVAQAIINDYTSSLLAVSPPYSAPGLVAVRGDYTDRKEVAAKFMKELMVARSAQNQWFSNLVDIADDTWSKTHSPVGISDLQRSACRMLGRQRDWLNPLPSEVLEKCPFCQNTINAGAIKCVTCNEILDKKKYSELVGTK